jgi:hypothetical protein
VENFDHIDQIIRQKFENFEPEPPARVWENVRSKISNTPPPAPSGLMLPILFVVTFLLFIGSLVFNLITGINEEVPEFDGTSRTHLRTAGMISTGSTTGSGQTLQNAIYQTIQDNHLQQVLSGAPQTGEPVTSKPEIKVKAPFQPITATSGKDNGTTSEAQSASTNSARGPWTPGLRQALAAGEITVATAVKYDLSMKDVRKLSGYQENASNRTLGWMIGVYFNPEVSIHQSSNLENTVSYSIGLMPQVSFSHFFIQSGINARFTHDKGNSSVSYNRFLGTYDDVYLVTFDSTENGIIPTYYTEEVDVYDTIDHYAISETQANYTYLEVPVLFGYRHDFGKMSVFAKGGPSAAFLIRQNIPVQDPEEDARIVDVDYQVPARSQVNWNLMFGAGIDYRLSEWISFSLEPTFRYSLKSEYDIPDDAGAKSHSFGIRAGLNYKF